MALGKLFKGKETYKEELAEGNAIKSGKITPEQYAKGEEMEKPKKMDKGGNTMKKKSVNPAMAVMAARAMRTPAQAPMQAPMAPPPVPGGAPMGGMGGGMGMKSGGRTPVKGDHSVQKKDKVGAKMIKMASGGLSAGHKSANGVATKGLTKGKMVSMCGGGMGKKSK